MKKETGGPAFPQAVYNMKGGYDITGGMSLRDYFAAQAMQGLGSQLSIYSVTVDEVAELSYRQADAMLKEREK
jgi:hypothetical protein